MNKTYGYVRVSTNDQDTALQVDALKAFGCHEDDIIHEKKSGKDMKNGHDTGRPERCAIMLYT